MNGKARETTEKNGSKREQTGANGKKREKTQPANAANPKPEKQQKTTTSKIDSAYYLPTTSTSKSCQAEPKPKTTSKVQPAVN